MTEARVRSGFLSLLVLLVMAMTVGGLTAQSTKMPSTLRYGSGLIDIPTASVLPHMAITATYSGFKVNVANSVVTNASGQAISTAGPAVNQWMSDASVAVGLFDRVELGATFQSFSNSATGGTMAGGFGRVAILQPQHAGIGLAVGARIVSAPSFTGLTNPQPGRLGFPSRNLVKNYTGAGAAKNVNTQFTPYGVATVTLPGLITETLPNHDFTVSVGFGDGLFKDGGDLGFHALSSAQGWFFGSAVHVEVAEDAVLNLMGDYNGFDVNIGAQLDFRGIRVGGFLLGANYASKVSTFRSRKFGIIGSVALCPAEGGLCTPSLMARPAPDTVQLPAPPPDTVIIERNVGRELPTGRTANVCLATGASEAIVITAQGDTLVGPERVSIRTLRPGVVFAGTYAQGADWFVGDDAIAYDRIRYRKVDTPRPMDCRAMMRVGENEGVPLFADSDASQPYPNLYAPVTPGLWQRYENTSRTTGD